MARFSGWRAGGIAGKQAPTLESVLRNIWSGFAGAGWLDQLNLVLGVVGVGLMIKRSLWAFPVGLAAVTVQGGLFWQAHFPADALLQIFYFGSLAWGWWNWTRGERRTGGERREAGGERVGGAELAVTRLSGRERLITLVGAVVATVGWALWVGPALGAAMPWRDAFIAAFSVAAQVLQVRKHIENWALWAVVNGVAVASYWSADLAYTAFLYAVYFGMALVGWREWWRAMGKRERREKENSQRGGRLGEPSLPGKVP